MIPKIQTIARVQILTYWTADYRIPKIWYKHEMLGRDLSTGFCKLYF